MKNNGCDLSSVRFLVLDEADKMLSPGFVNEVEEVMSLLPAGCQKAVFSATFPFKVRPKVHKMLSEGYVKVGGEQAEGVEAGQGEEESPAPDIKHRALLVDEGKRTSLLKKLIEDSIYSRLLVFANTKYDCEVRKVWNVIKACVTPPPAPIQLLLTPPHRATLQPSAIVENCQGKNRREV